MVKIILFVNKDIGHSKWTILEDITELPTIAHVGDLIPYDRKINGEIKGTAFKVIAVVHNCSEYVEGNPVADLYAIEVGYIHTYLEGLL